LSCFLAIRYNFKIHFDFVLFGLAIAFPLGTSIQTAFKRRERALEYLSLFNSGILAVHYSFKIAEKLSSDKKEEIKNVLMKIAENFLNQLRSSDGDMNRFQVEADRIFVFMETNSDVISSKTSTRVVRYYEDIIDGSTYLLSLIKHRTMAGLRSYSLIFISLFAALHGPMLFQRLDQVLPVWAVYFSAAFSALVLITLYNFQQLIEYPFDQKGSDDVKLDEFKLKLL
jgi:hypothetical protein